jgi:hypothetical protein
MLQLVLPERRTVGGWLEEVDPVGNGLLRVTISGRTRYVDESLQEELVGMMGEHMVVGYVLGKWRCGRIPV